MKKVIKKMLCTIACVVGLIGSVDAATLAIGNDSVSAGASRNVSIELIDDGNNLKDFNKVEFQLGVSGTAYASIDSFALKSTAMDFATTGADSKTYVFKNDSGLIAGNLGTINYKTSSELVGDFKITPINVKFYKADGTYMQPGDSGVKISEGTIKYEKPKSNEAWLTSLTVSQGTMTPEFSSEVMEYTVVVKDTINSVRITANSSAGSTKTGTGYINLNMGANEVNITVTAEDGVTKNTYKLNLILGSVSEPSAYLTSLDVNNIGAELSPKFEKENNKYTVKIDKKITKLDFIYEREDALAEVDIEGNENFVEGENLVKITVKSSNGEDVQVYEITVLVEEEKDEDTEPIVPDKNDEPEKKNNIWLIVIIVTVILLIVIGVSIVLFKKNKKKKEDSKLPLKKRSGDEPTYEIERVKNTNETVEEIEEEADENRSVTAILKGELFDDEKTQKFDSKVFKEAMSETDDEVDDQTKEFDFKNLDK